MFPSIIFQYLRRKKCVFTHKKGFNNSFKNENKKTVGKMLADEIINFFLHHYYCFI